MGAEGPRGLVARGGPGQLRLGREGVRLFPLVMRGATWGKLSTEEVLNLPLALGGMTRGKKPNHPPTLSLNARRSPAPAQRTRRRTRRRRRRLGRMP